MPEWPEVHEVLQIDDQGITRKYQGKLEHHILPMDVLSSIEEVYLVINGYIIFKNSIFIFHRCLVSRVPGGNLEPTQF